ncbi:MAG TPA: DUF4349 domain-containing protein [Armatimonadota bacterium]|jgi:septum formation inhibitor MinC
MPPEPDDFASPLDRVLTTCPLATPPPADLEERCLATLHRLAEEERFAARRAPSWRPVLAAAAAGLVLSLAAWAALSALSPHAPVDLSDPLAPRLATVLGPAEPVFESAPAAPAVAPAPAGKGKTPAAALAESTRPAPGYVNPERRRQLLYSVLHLDVEELNPALQQASSLIDSAGGFLEESDLRLEERLARRQASFRARVPAAQLEALLTSLRALGQVQVVRNDSEDATKDFREKGATIREAGADEDALVARYLKTKNLFVRQRLYEQILDMRRHNQAQKRSIKTLDEASRWALLEVSMRERLTLHRVAVGAVSHLGPALAWTGATAVVWLPLMVLLALARRRPAAG